MKKHFIKGFEPWEFEPILDSISDAIFIDDANGYTLWCNKACYDLYKITPEDVIGAHISDLEQSGIFSPSVAR
ncbi:MAG: PAS domain-containing protein, partial [Anaerovoracaceae bacterium]